jgi:uncharacterized protein (TIGR02145 family)
MKEIKIGEQIWAAENLNVDRFQNGDIMAQAISDEDWVNAGIKMDPCWCYYENELENGKLFGKLYNWYAVNDPRQIAPIGWKIPSDIDINILDKFLGSEENAGKKLKSSEYWLSNEIISNDYHFNALPGGVVNDEFVFYDLNEWGCWWSSTEEDQESAKAFNLSNDFEELGWPVNDDKRYGLSIRCLKKSC